MNKKLMLLSHGHFCVELKKSVEMIMGPQENIITVPLLEEEGKEEYKEKLLSVINKDTENIVLADLKGGTPGNIASELLLEGYSFDLYTGMNMQWLLIILIVIFWRLNLILYLQGKIILFILINC